MEMVINIPFMKTLYTILLSFIVLNCSNDGLGLGYEKNVEGTVTGTVSCNTDMGLAYAITPDNFELSSGFIITGTLPDEFKQEGLKIKFDMVPSKEHINICTANFFPEQFYKVFNVRILNERQ